MDNSFSEVLLVVSYFLVSAKHYNQPQFTVLWYDCSLKSVLLARLYKKKEYQIRLSCYLVSMVIWNPIIQVKIYYLLSNTNKMFLLDFKFKIKKFNLVQCNLVCFSGLASLESKGINSPSKNIPTRQNTSSKSSVGLLLCRRVGYLHSLGGVDKIYWIN